jgi:GNAT superfamily N-acetyltransferase
MLDLFRRGTDPRDLGRSIYAAPRVDRYLVMLALDPRKGRYERLWGLKDGNGRLVAAAHIRMLGEASHLNLLTVDPGLQGRGLGTWMLSRWDRMASLQGASRQTLDVAEGNLGAQRMALRHGFTVTSRTWEFRHRGGVRPRARTGILSGVVVRLWREAQDSYLTYGFGRFLLELDGRECQVDLAREFRVPDPDPRILAFLARLDPGRGILLRTALPDPPGDWEATGSVFRMGKDVRDVPASLAQPGA